MTDMTENDKGGSGGKRSATVNIFGREYRIRSNEKEETVQRIARYVDKKMREVAKSTASPDPLGVAVLVALNVTGEYLPDREERQATAGMTADRVKKLIQTVDKALSTTGPVRSPGRSR